MRASWLLQDAWRSIARNRAGFAMATSVQAVCLVLLGMFVLAAVGLAQFTTAARRQIEIQVFLEPDADAAATGGRIACLSGVSATRFVSREEALAELQSELDADSALLAVLETNPLPASYRVTLAAGADPEELAGIEHKLALLPGVSEIWSGSETIARLGRILRVLVAVTAVVIVVASLAVVFIAFSTVEASLVARAREIEIMELVGATPASVRLPFVIEGCIQGLLGGAAAGLILLTLLALARAFIVPFPIPLGPLAAGAAGLGLALGLAGSLFALGRLSR
ncbi:MAG: permease-like cell division protein FtsX [bacterium]